MTPSRLGIAPLAVTVTAAMVVLTACGGSSGKSTTPTSSPAGQGAEVTATPGAGGVQEVTIDGTNSLRFTPATIVVAPGEVKVTLRNTGQVPHDFVLDAFHATQRHGRRRRRAFGHLHRWCARHLPVSVQLPRCSGHEGSVDRPLAVRSRPGDVFRLVPVHLDALDLLLIVVVIAAALAGYRRGFVAGALGFVGFVGGAVVGVLVAPPIARTVGSWFGGVASGERGQAVIVLVGVLALIGLGRFAASSIGEVLHGRITWRPARLVDSAGGAALSAVAVLLVAWFLASTVVHSPFPLLARQATDSRILATVDRAVPATTRTWFTDFRKIVVATGVPQVFGRIGAERIAPVVVPDPTVVNAAGVTAARQSVVKIVGVAPSCERRLEGSGFVIAPGRVLTNAHVVAGVQAPRVYTDGGTVLRARVVLYDPERDVAVLAVPGLDRPALTWAAAADVGASAVVAGFPENGPYLVSAARVRSVIDAQGLDIYQDQMVSREVYALRATVHPGNSGGPLLTPDGHVYGVVFAKSPTDDSTAYALTHAEVAPAVAAGTNATAPVSTLACS